MIMIIYWVGVINSYFRFAILGEKSELVKAFQLGTLV